MGIPLSFTDQEGPRLEPVRDLAGIRTLRRLDGSECPFVMTAIELCRRELRDKVPLIGFAGAPFTLLTYAVEGHTGKQFLESKRLLFAAPDAAHELLSKLTESIGVYLKAQVAAGAQAIQIFDSWVGILSLNDFKQFAAPYLRQLLDTLRPLGVPLIYFANDGAALLSEVGQLPADVFGLDWRLPLDQAAERLRLQERPLAAALQGNLDPCALFAPPDDIERRVRDILAAAPKTGHIFNLGHGILPPTPVEHAQAAVAAVHRLSAR